MCCVVDQGVGILFIIHYFKCLYTAAISAIYIYIYIYIEMWLEREAVMNYTDAGIIWNL